MTDVARNVKQSVTLTFFILFNSNAFQNVNTFDWIVINIL